jgi:hypothetical protein
MVGLLNKKTLRHLYSVFIKLPPFNRYPMPSPIKMRFEVMESDDSDGLFTPDNKTIHIEIRQNSFKKMSEVLLHEMIHVLLYERNKYTNKYAEHDGSFAELADEICKLYKFNRKTF